MFALHSEAEAEAVPSPPPSPMAEVSFVELVGSPLPRRRVSRRRSSLFVESGASAVSPPLVGVPVEEGSRAPSADAVAPRASAVSSPSTATPVRTLVAPHLVQGHESVSETDSEIDLDASLEATAYRAGVMARSSSTGEAEPSLGQGRLGPVARASSKALWTPPARRLARSEGMEVGKADVYKLVRRVPDEPERDGEETSEEEERFDMMMDGGRRASLGSSLESTPETVAVFSPFSVRSGGGRVRGMWREEEDEVDEVEALVPTRKVEAAQAALELHRAMAAQRRETMRQSKPAKVAHETAITDGDSSEPDSPLEHREATPKPSRISCYGPARKLATPQTPSPAVRAPPPPRFLPARRPSVESSGSAAPTDFGGSSASSDETRRSSVASSASAGGMRSPASVKGFELGASGPLPPPPAAAGSAGRGVSPSLLRQPSRTTLKGSVAAKPGVVGSSVARSGSHKREGGREKENVAHSSSLPRPTSTARGRIPVLRTAKSTASLSPSNSTPASSSPAPKSPMPSGLRPVTPSAIPRPPTTPSALPRPTARATGYASLRLGRVAVPPLPAPRAQTIGGPPAGIAGASGVGRGQLGVAGSNNGGTKGAQGGVGTGVGLSRAVVTKGGVGIGSGAGGGRRGLPRPVAKGPRREAAA